MSAVDQYHAQNGIKPTGRAEPWVVRAVRNAARQTGADPVALLATALQESGGQRGRVGDSGTSYGPWQFHRGGALGSHTPAWANSFAAALNRAQEFARLGVHGGKGAAAVQRPFDQALYARGVDSQLTEARRILGQPAVAVPSPAGRTRRPAPLAASPASSADSIEGGTPQDRLALVDYFRQPHETRNIADLIGLVGATHPTVAPPAPVAPVADLIAGGQAPDAPPGEHGSPIGVTGAKLIGVPYQGTHTKYGNWESDNAIDIPAPVGTPIYATMDGTIGSQIGALSSSDPHLLGLRVHLDGKGQRSYYAHLSKLAVKAGQHVKKGQIIGYSGSANGVSHLHFGVQNGDPRRYYA